MSEPRPLLLLADLIEREAVDCEEVGHPDQFSQLSTRLDLRGWVTRMVGAHGPFPLSHGEAAELLGIERETMLRLCLPASDEAHWSALPGELGHISRDRMIDALRYLDRTGEVPWRHQPRPETRRLW